MSSQPPDKVTFVATEPYKYQVFLGGKFIGYVKRMVNGSWDERHEPSWWFDNSKGNHGSVRSRHEAADALVQLHAAGSTQ